MNLIFSSLLSSVAAAAAFRIQNDAKVWLTVKLKEFGGRLIYY